MWHDNGTVELNVLVSQRFRWRKTEGSLTEPRAIHCGLCLRDGVFHILADIRQTPWNVDEIRDHCMHMNAKGPCEFSYPQGLGNARLTV